MVAVYFVIFCAQTALLFPLFSFCFSFVNMSASTTTPAPIAPYRTQRLCPCKKVIAPESNKTFSCPACNWDYCSRACYRLFKKDHVKSKKCETHRLLNFFMYANSKHFKLWGVYLRHYSDTDDVRGIRIEINEPDKIEKVSVLTTQSIDIVHSKFSYGAGEMYASGYPHVFVVFVELFGILIGHEIDLVEPTMGLIGIARKDHPVYSTEPGKYLIPPKQAADGVLYDRPWLKQVGMPAELVDNRDLHKLLTVPVPKDQSGYIVWRHYKFEREAKAAAESKAKPSPAVELISEEPEQKEEVKSNKLEEMD